MAEDRYEKVLLNWINQLEKEVKKGGQKIERLKVRGSGHPDWSDTNLKVIEATVEMNKTRGIKIDTIWACLNHHRSLIGVEYG